MNDRPASLTAWERRVHAALVHASDDAPPDPTAPNPDAIWDAVDGQLAPREAQAVLDAAALSPAAFSELRLALALSSELAEATLHHSTVRAPSDRSSRVSRWLPVALAVAAALLATLTLSPRRPADTAAHGAEYRDAASERIHAKLQHAQSLPRDAFVLSWEPLPLARYTVSVSTESARMLVQRRGLEAAELTVPAGALAELPAGSRVLWRVEAVLPDGSHVRSQTFIVVVQ